MLTSVFRTRQFERDAKALFKKHRDPDRLRAAVEALMSQNREVLLSQWRDHALAGSWKGYREIHLEGDWLVIYRVEKKELVLVLTRTGTHDELF